jgi:hypothetical protein
MRADFARHYFMACNALRRMCTPCNGRTWLARNRPMIDMGRSGWLEAPLRRNNA